MVSAWLIMLAAGNFGHLFNDPRWYVSYWFCLPIGILVDLWLFLRGRRK